MKPIPGMPEYYATENGFIYSRNGREGRRKYPRQLKPFDTAYGLRVVKITLPTGKEIFPTVRRLIALAYLPPPLTSKAEAHLIDKDKPLSAYNVYWRENKNELEAIKARELVEGE